MRLGAPTGLIVAGVVAVLAAAGCGGSSESAADRARETAAYAQRVSAISTATEQRLAALADRSDYRRAAAAAASTREYAAGIRDAAAELRRVTPPAPAVTQHTALAELYRRTATLLDGLADRFAAAPDAAELGVLAQELSSAVQVYASQEQELRAAIQRVLAPSPSPAPAGRGVSRPCRGGGRPRWPRGAAPRPRRGRPR